MQVGRGDRAVGLDGGLAPWGQVEHAGEVKDGLDRLACYEGFKGRVVDVVPGDADPCASVRRRARNRPVKERQRQQPQLPKPPAQRKASSGRVGQAPVFPLLNTASPRFKERENQAGERNKKPICSLEMKKKDSNIIANLFVSA